MFRLDEAAVNVREQIPWLVMAVLDDIDCIKIDIRTDYEAQTSETIKDPTLME